MLNQVSENSYPHINRVYKTLSKVWPEHDKYFAKSMNIRNPEQLQTTEEIAELILGLVDDEMLELCEDYRFFCDTLLEEELYFRRHDDYRLKSFEETNRQVYANKPFMKKYVNGILLAHFMWSNHLNATHFYINEFLKKAPDNHNFLEIGPGHGLLMYFALSSGRLNACEGWDVSPTSLEHARKYLNKWNVDPNTYRLQEVDIMQAHSDTLKFDTLVLSEILEHLEDPITALKNCRQFLNPGGRVYVHVPVNSPAPDHIYLWRTPEEAVQFVQDCGFSIETYQHFPMAGYDLEKARKRKVTISSCIIGKLD